jgi:hypothetical protein
MIKAFLTWLLSDGNPTLSERNGNGQGIYTEQRKEPTLTKEKKIPALLKSPSKQKSSKIGCGDEACHIPVGDNPNE